MPLTPVISVKPLTRIDYERRLQRVLGYIRQHLDQELNLAQLADIAHFSPYHFHRIFRGLVGENLGSHVKRLRMERAASDLLYTQQSVTEAAFDAGFETPESFSRAFKKSFGVTPSRYRKESGFCFPDKAPNGLWTTAMEFQFDRLWDDKDGPMKLNVQIENHDEMHIAFVRHQGAYEEVEPVFDKLYALAEKANILLWDDAEIIMLSHDDSNITESKYLRADAGIVIPNLVCEIGEMQKQTIEAGQFAVAHFQGAYDYLDEAYDWIYGGWLPDSGREAADGPAIEIYHNDPMNVVVAKLLTEIRIPLVARS
ncbi:AraC family transcriptional regulator [Kiloniella antarctica]|uniref:GyrI-like domain-containing protein n=1 Tax=Kiloniella antarctica TaxID=1550907 RepID=A0ABW5BGU0_9PROT